MLCHRDVRTVLIAMCCAGALASLALSASAQTRDEREGWDERKPPPQWPVFTKVPGKQPAAIPKDPLGFARDIENRWHAGASRPTTRPSVCDTGKAIEALQSIAPNDARYPEAWARFVRMRKLDRTAMDHEQALPETQRCYNKRTR